MKLRRLRGQAFLVAHSAWRTGAWPAMAFKYASGMREVECSSTGYMRKVIEPWGAMPVRKNCTRCSLVQPRSLMASGVRAGT